jgi:hypothetical protein
MPCAAINETETRAEHIDSVLKELNLLDQAWSSIDKVGDEPSDLSALSPRFAYLTRWITQLKERKFQLSI